MHRREAYPDDGRHRFSNSPKTIYQGLTIDWKSCLILAKAAGSAACRYHGREFVPDDRHVPVVPKTKYMPKPPYLYYPVHKAEFEDIRANGLDPEREHYDTLKKARKVKGRVLVVSEKAARKGRIKPKHIGNLSPFRRAVRLQAGGGVLLRRKKGTLETVLIYRRGKWDIPKGKRDKGESKKACAVREVNEELGIDDARILWKAGRTTHGYKSRKRRFAVKITHWYVMETSAKTFVPQADEQITDAQWVPLKEAKKKVDYKILRRLLKDVEAQVEEKGF